MKFPWSPDAGPLRGAYVFLSASVPDPKRHARYLRGPGGEQDMKDIMVREIEGRVDDAVKSLVAHVLAAGGRIVHGGHPQVTPFIADQACHWKIAGNEGAPEQSPAVVTYQSKYFEKFSPVRGRVEMERAGVAQTRWVAPTLAGASEEWHMHSRDSWRPAWFASEMLSHWLPAQAPLGRASLREPLLAMRLRMLAECAPIAAICIGGMEGVEAEAFLYQDLVRHGRIPAAGRVQVIGSTFGATAQLEEQGFVMADRAEGLPERPDYNSVMRNLVRDLAQSIG